MVAETVLGNVQEQAEEAQVVPVDFEWFELEKKRIRKQAEDGTDIGVCISQELKEGDILARKEGKVYAVHVLPSKVIRIPVHTMTEMGRLGFELGNRHMSLKITEQEIVVPFDQPTYEYLLKLGFAAEEVTEQFTDFIVCKAHGHTHTHSHSGENHVHEG